MGAHREQLEARSAYAPQRTDDSRTPEAAHRRIAHSSGLETQPWVVERAFAWLQVAATSRSSGTNACRGSGAKHGS